jgi:hypothetical protein
MYAKQPLRTCSSLRARPRSAGTWMALVLLYGASMIRDKQFRPRNAPAVTRGAHYTWRL